MEYRVLSSDERAKMYGRLNTDNSNERYMCQCGMCGACTCGFCIGSSNGVEKKSLNEEFKSRLESVASIA